MDKIEAEDYAAYLETIPDIALKTEWDNANARDEKFLISQEMAKRFRKPSPQQSYYINKLLDMPEQFKNACCKKEWCRAMRIYSDAVTIGVFLEIPIEFRREIFGDDERKTEGMIPHRLVERVYLECSGRDEPGHECTVCRIPGKIGIYGAQTRSGTRHTSAEENPSYKLVKNARDGQFCLDLTTGTG